jgi:16S rRNA (guanine1207-N2)-methyltransferase
MPKVILCRNDPFVNGNIMTIRNMKFPKTTPAYTQFHQIEVNLEGRSLQVITKPGLPNWYNPTPADQLLNTHVRLEPDSSAILLGCEKGIAATVIANELSRGHLWTTDIHSLSLDCTRKTLKVNNVMNCTVLDDISLLPQYKNSLNAAIIVLPKGRAFARRWLVEVYEVLSESSIIYLVGANSEGVQSLLKDAELLFGSKAVILGYKKGHRLARLQKSCPNNHPEWATEPGIAPGSWYTFQLDLGWTSFRINSLPGVFSYQHLDEGTKFLLDYLRVSAEDRILDVGCGYGIIGLTIARLLGEPVEMDMVDSNLLSVASTKRNLEENIPEINRSMIRVSAGDLMSQFIGREYSLVVSNPPFHSGKSIDYSITMAMIQQASQILSKDGRFLLVANKFIRYEHFLQKYFSRVTRVAQDNRYKILESTEGL